MQDYTFRLATQADKPAIISFMNLHWGEKHPLVNNEQFFDFYYQDKNRKLRFVLAEMEGHLAAIAGYIPANETLTPDIWVSLWISDPAYSGAGLALMEQFPALTQCKTLACNNIRPKTQVLYQFLGYTTGKVSHFYRLAPKETYQVALIKHHEILPASGTAMLKKIETAGQLENSGFIPPVAHNPYKDISYITHRYFSYPYQNYDVWLAKDPTTSESALLITRTTPVENTCVLRIVDYIGNLNFLPNLGNAVQTLLLSQNAEYIDFYCVGIPKKILTQTGFVERIENDENIIPNYLTPPLFENIDFYYFTSNPENFTLFKADGDQDRPNIP